MLLTFSQLIGSLWGVWWCDVTRFGAVVSGSLMAGIFLFGIHLMNMSGMQLCIDVFCMVYKKVYKRYNNLKDCIHFYHLYIHIYVYNHIYIYIYIYIYYI